MYKFFKILALLIFNFLFLHTSVFSSEEKIKIGLLIPLTGEDKEIGHQIVQSTRIALKDINSNKLEIYPKDTNSDPNKTVKSAISNAENNHQFDIDNLFVKEAYVGKSLVMKRFRPRAKGRASPIKKPFSRITIVLEEKKEKKVSK